MQLNCICGRAGSGKSRYVSWQIKRAMERGMRVYLIVPDQYTLQAERELIRHIAAPGLMQAEVLSFTRLAERVLELTGSCGLPYINTRGRAMAVSKLLLQNADQLQAYASYVRSPGFVARLADGISEFKRFDISPERLAGAADTPQLMDIALIYRQYASDICSRYYDSEDRMDMMIEQLPQAGFMQGACVFIDGFEMLTKQIYRLIAALLRCCAELNITFRLGDESDADAPIFETERKHLGKVKEIARDNNAALRMDWLPQPGPWGGTRHGKSQLTHLERNLYALPYEAYSGEDDGSVELCYAENIEKEADICTARMLTLARGGCRWRDMMLVCNDIQRYAPTLKRAFARQGIPCFIDDKRGVHTHPFARFCIQSLACLRSGFARQDVLELFKTGFSALDDCQCSRLENLIAINNARWLGPGYTAAVEPEQMDELRQRLLGSLYKLAGDMKPLRNPAEMAVAFYSYLESSGAMERLQSFISGLEQDGDYDAAEVAVQVHAALASVLQQAHDLMGDTACDIAEFCGMVRAGLEAEAAGVIPSTVDSVFCGSLERSRAGDIKAMFIVGINDDILPGNIFASGLINERGMERLHDEHGIYLGHNSAERAAEQELSIYTAVSKPNSFLHLSCSLAGSDGKELTPYPLLEDIRRRLPAARAKTPVNRAFADSLGSYAFTRLPLAHAMREHRYGRNVDTRWAHVYDAYKKSGQPVPDFSRRQDYIGNSLARELYGSHMRASATRLENYMLCPFKFFMRYGLHPVEKPEYGHSPLDVGNYYHAALQSFVQGRQDWQLEAVEIDAAMDDICDELDAGLLSGQYAQDGRERAGATNLRENAKGAARAIAEQMREGSFWPLQTEMEFCHTIRLQTGEAVEIVGAIDRLDVYQRGEERFFRIIDYKTSAGSAAFDCSKLWYGSSIQLPLYASAIQQAMGAVPAGMFYMRIKEDIPKLDDSKPPGRQRLASHKLGGVLLAEKDIVAAMGGAGQNDILPAYLTKKEKINSRAPVAEGWQMRNLIERGVANAKKAAEGIYSGSSHPNPMKGELDSCKYCEYSAQCGFEDANDDIRFTEEIKLDKLLGGGTDA